MKESIIIEIKIGNQVDEKDGLGNQYTSCFYMAKFRDGQILQVLQSAWPDASPYDGTGRYLKHWTEEEWIEEAKDRYSKRQQSLTNQ